MQVEVLAEEFVSKDARAKAKKAYEGIQVPAFAIYTKAIASAGKAHEENMASAKRIEEGTLWIIKTYMEATASAKRAYVEAVAPAWKVFNETIQELNNLCV